VKVAGVCGGIAEYFNVDTTLIRILALLLLFTGGGVLFYIIAWIVIPEAPRRRSSVIIDDNYNTYNDYDDYDSDSDYQYTEADPNKSKYLLGWGLVVFSSIMIMNRIFPNLPFRQYMIPVMILIGGYYLISQSSNK
jgi:phage shock protein C